MPWSEGASSREHASRARRSQPTARLAERRALWDDGRVRPLVAASLGLLLTLAGCRRETAASPPPVAPGPWTQTAPNLPPPAALSQPVLLAPVPCPELPATTSQAPAPQGTLTVHTDPPGAMVFWRGVFVGGSPLEAARVEAGTQQLLVVLPRYEPIFVTVTVRPGESTLEELSFKPPAPASIPAPVSRGAAPPEYDPSRCSRSECERDCFRDGFHCKTDCGYGNPGCETTCKQLQAFCERSCERECP
jgi:hypothetical protein